MKLNFLTNTNPLLQEKMRFFADYLSFANDFLGLLPGLPFENPISLIDKIIFQFEHNLSRCPKSVDVYISELMKFEFGLTEQASPGFANVRSDFVVNWRACGTDAKKVEWIKNNLPIIEQLRQCSDELKTNLFETVFVTLKKYMLCSHSLSEHKLQIESTTHLLVTIFRLNNVPKDQVASYIDRILSNDPYEFPLPVDLLQQAGDESFVKLKNHFFSNRDFQKQFDGLKNIIDAYSNRSGLFLFPLKGFVLEKDQQNNFETCFDRVTFYFSGNSRLNNIKQKIEEEKAKKNNEMPGRDNFFDEQHIIACIKMPYEKRPDAAKIARSIVEEELKFFNAYLKEPFVSLYSTDWIFTEDLQSQAWSGSFQMIGRDQKVCYPNEYEIGDLINNPFMRLRGKSIAAAEQILRNEEVFFTAFSRDDISSYWLYIENIFWQTSTEKRKVKTLFADLCMNIVPHIMGRLNASIGFLLNRYHMDNPEEMAGLSKDQAKEIFDATRTVLNQRVEWSKYTGLIKHTFLKDVITLSQELSDANSLIKWKSFFLNLSQELSDYRNADFHGGKMNQFTEIKLSNILHSIINDIRWEIIHLAEENPALSFVEIIDKMAD